MLNWFRVVDVCSTPFTHRHSTYGLMSVLFSCSCCSYSIIKNPLNFDVHHKVCAPLNASAGNYFWWINQKDKYVRSSSCSFQFSLYTSPSGAIVVMLQLVISVAWLSLRMGDDNADLNQHKCQKCVCGQICREVVKAEEVPLGEGEDAMSTAAQQQLSLEFLFVVYGLCGILESNPIISH